MKINSTKLIEHNIDILDNKLRGIPNSGDFEASSIEFPLNVDDLNVTVQITVGPWSRPAYSSTIKNWQDMRYFEVKVYAANKQVDSSEWLCSGPNERLHEFCVQSKKDTSVIQQSIKRAIEHLQRDFL